MPRRSNKFQRLYYQIQRSLSDENARVEESVEVWNDASGRKDEIDVLITFEHSAHNFVIGVQCRDHSRPAGPNWIRDLKLQRDDCRMDKMVAVHSIGFTKPAIKAAKRHHIEILTLRTAERSNWTRFRPNRLRVNMPPRVTRIELLPKFEVPATFNGDLLRETLVVCKTHRCPIGTPKELAKRVIRSKEFRRKLAAKNFGWASLQVDWPFPNHFLCINGRHVDFSVMRLHVRCAAGDVPVDWQTHQISGDQARAVDELVAQVGDREMRILFPDQFRSKKILIDLQHKPRQSHPEGPTWFKLNDL